MAQRSARGEVLAALVLVLWKFAEPSGEDHVVRNHRPGTPIFDALWGRINGNDSKDVAGEKPFDVLLEAIETAATLKTRVQDLEKLELVALDRDSNSVGRPVGRIRLLAPCDEMRAAVVRVYPEKERSAGSAKTVSGEAVVDAVRQEIAPVRNDLRKLFDEVRQWTQPLQRTAREEGTLLLVDYENGRGLLKIDDAYFPAAFLRRSVETRWPVIRAAYAFTGTYGTPHIRVLQEAGYIVVCAPPSVEGAKDNVDPTLIAVAESHRASQNLSHIVLVSGDHGYVGMVDSARAAGQQVGLVVPNIRAKGVSAALLQRVGEQHVLELMPYAKDDLVVFYARQLADGCPDSDAQYLYERTLAVCRTLNERLPLKDIAGCVARDVMSRRRGAYDAIQIEAFVISISLLRLCASEGCCAVPAARGASTNSRSSRMHERTGRRQRGEHDCSPRFLYYWPPTPILELEANNCYLVYFTH